MAILGAHQSIAGGYYKAVDRAYRLGCDCVQLFTKNNNQWSAKDITPTDAKQFRDAIKKTGIIHPIAHDSYLINLASPDKKLWRKSVEAFVLELRRAEILEIPFVVTHPGAYTTGTEQGGLKNVVRAIDEIHAQTQNLRTQCLLETTAGQGTTLGWQFEQLAQIINDVKQPERLGVCFDTCHVFAAGYAFGTSEEYCKTMDALDRTVGIDRVRAFHLNDSLRPLGSRVDRHEHIGHGRLGIEPFRLLLNDRRFQKIPMYLETPKDRREDGENWDIVNLRTLHNLVASGN